MLTRTDFCSLHGEDAPKAFRFVVANKDGMEVPVCFECVCTLIVSLGLPHNSIGDMAVVFRNSTVAYHRKIEKEREERRLSS